MDAGPSALLCTYARLNTHNTPMSTISNIAGRQVHIDSQGRETKQSDTTTVRLNGPHHDAKWARRLLGTDISQSMYRSNRISALARSLFTR